MANPYGDQLEACVYSASPVELTRMLIDKLLSEIRSARRCLHEGDIRQRCLSVSRAVDVAGELARSLDEERGGEFSVRLRLLYTYVVEQLNEANMRQQEKGFANAEAVMIPLAEGWGEISGAVREQTTFLEPLISSGCDSTGVGRLSLRG